MDFWNLPLRGRVSLPGLDLPDLTVFEIRRRRTSLACADHATPPEAGQGPMPLAPQNIRYSAMAAGPALHNDLRKRHLLAVGGILADDRTSTLERVAQAARRGRRRLSLPLKLRFHKR